jgi:hypothetical protein
MDVRVTSSKEFKDFMAISKETKRYYKAFVQPPSAVLSRYDQIKANYCHYLDSINMKIPKQKYLFDKKDSKTHKYLTIENEKKFPDKTHLRFEKVKCEDKYVKIYLNPDFKY